MPSIFDGVNEIVDDFLKISDDWEGQAPRYGHRATLIRLCREDGPDIDGLAMVRSMSDHISNNWNGSDGQGRPSKENWRFEKRLDVSDENTSSETILDRTISRVCDENWANQVPVDSGLLGGRAHWIDLIFRAGTAFSFIELKDESNTPLSAAIQVLRYGLVYAFTRSHAAKLGMDLDSSPILGASEVHLRVLAPSAFYTGYGPNQAWLSRFQKSVHTGVEAFSLERGKQLPRMSFRFEAFPDDFLWENQTAQTAQQASTQKEVLWSVHRRKPVFLPTP